MTVQIISATVFDFLSKVRIMLFCINRNPVAVIGFDMDILCRFIKTQRPVKSGIFHILRNHALPSIRFIMTSTASSGDRWLVSITI